MDKSIFREAEDEFVNKRETRGVSARWDSPSTAWVRVSFQHAGDTFFLRENNVFLVLRLITKGTGNIKNVHQHKAC